MKRFIAILLAAAMLFALAACGDQSSDKKDEIDADGNHKLSSKGITITLPAEYYVYEDLDPTLYAGVETAFTNETGDVAIYVVREKISDLKVDDSFTAADYLKELKGKAEGMVASEITEQDGVTYFTYTESGIEVADGDAESTADEEYLLSIKYMNVAYKAGDSFWLLQFFCTAESFDGMTPEFIKWAKTVSFD